MPMAHQGFDYLEIGKGCPCPANQHNLLQKHGPIVEFVQGFVPVIGIFDLRRSEALIESQLFPINLIVR